jgi:hypothetical protein
MRDTFDHYSNIRCNPKGYKDFFNYYGKIT